MRLPYFACNNCEFKTESSESALEHITDRYDVFGEWHKVNMVSQEISAKEAYEILQKQKERKW